MRFPFIFALSCALLPSLAYGEGGKRVLDCQVTKICDGTGTCSPSAEQVTFAVKPIKRGPKGEGPHLIEYNGVTATAENVTGTGPFVWSTDGQNVNTLLFASEITMIWHQLVFDPKATSTTQFLTCKDAS